VFPPFGSPQFAAILTELRGDFKPDPGESASEPPGVELDRLNGKQHSEVGLVVTNFLDESLGVLPADNTSTASSGGGAHDGIDEQP
jgi:hypothetical protein